MRLKSVGKVILYSGITRLDLPPDRILQKCIEADLEGVVVLGYDKEGREYFCSSYADGGIVMWLLERCKLKLLEAVAE